MDINRLRSLDLDFLTANDRKLFYVLATKDIYLKKHSTRVKPMTEKQEVQYHRILNTVITHFQAKA